MMWATRSYIDFCDTCVKKKGSYHVLLGAVDLGIPGKPLRPVIFHCVRVGLEDRVSRQGDASLLGHQLWSLGQPVVVLALSAI